MEQEKNLNETVEDAVEEVVETVEEVAEAVEEVAEKVRPEVYDDFGEEVEEAVEEVKEVKQMKPAAIIAISSAIATVASIVILVVGSLLINLVGGIITENQVEGAWGFDMGSYGGQNMKIYTIMEDGKMTLASNEGLTYFVCEYNSEEKGTITLKADQQNAAQMAGLGISTSDKIEVTYDKENDALVFSPALGGVATWTKVSDSEIETVKEAIANYVEPSYENMVPTETTADEETAEDTTEEVPVG